MDINTQRFLFASSGSKGGSNWITVNSSLSTQGQDDSFSTYGRLTINEEQKEILVAFDAYKVNNAQNDIVFQSWDLDGNFVKFTQSINTSVSTGQNTKGNYYLKTPSGTPVNIGQMTFSGLANTYVGNITVPDQSYDPAYRKIIYNLDGNIRPLDVVLGIKTNSTEAAAFISASGSGYPFALHLDYGPSGTVSPSNYTTWRTTDFPNLTTGPYANYSKQIQLFGQSSPDDYFISSFSALQTTQPYCAFYSYFSAFPLATTPAITFRVTNAYGTGNDIYSPKVIEQDNSKYLFGLFSSIENSTSIQNIVCFKYDVDTPNSISYIGFKPTNSTGTNAGLITTNNSSGLMDLEDENIANICCLMYDDGVTSSRYNMLLARLNVVTGEIIYSKRVAPYNPATGQETPVGLSGHSCLKYNKFGNIVVSAGCKLAIPESSSFCMTYDPVTGPQNGLYANSTSGFRIADYNLIPTSGDVYSFGPPNTGNITDFTGFSTDLSTVAFSGSVTTQTFDF